MNQIPAAAKIESTGAVTVISTIGGTICTIAPSYGKAKSANVNGTIVTVQTEGGYIVVYELSGYTPVLKSVRK
jgi:hypothetical protein